MKKLIFLFLFISSISYGQYWEESEGDIYNTNKYGSVHVGYNLYSFYLYSETGIDVGGGSYFHGVASFDNTVTMDGALNLNDNLSVIGNITQTGTFYYNNVPLTSSQWGTSYTGQTIFYPYNVGIGSENTGSFKLAVDGDIGSRGLKITLQNPWPDFVFSNKYELMSLPEVKKYIEINNKLPDIPSEQEVKENGMDVEEMTAKLLQKVEELTLHVIRLDEENTKLKFEIENLKINK